jgi:hypothetical protein
MKRAVGAFQFIGHFSLPRIALDLADRFFERESLDRSLLIRYFKV